MDGFWQIQIALNLALQSLGAWLLLPMQAVSFLGQEEFFMLVLPVFYWCVDSGAGLRLGVMLVLTNSLNGWLKVLFAQPRPFWIDRRVAALAIEGSFGLPSGHSQSAITMWGMAAWSQRRRWLVILAICVVILTGVSRIYLGMHFFTDVLGGWLVGGLLFWGYTRLEEPVLVILRRLPLGKILLLVALSSLVIIAISLLVGLTARPLPQAWVDNGTAATPGGTPDPYNPSTPFTLAGVWMGLGCGAAWQWRKVGPPVTGGPWKKRVLRYLVGLVGVAMIYFGLSAIFPRSLDIVGLSLRFLRYAVMGLWVSALAPAVFRRLRLV